METKPQDAVPGAIAEVQAPTLAEFIADAEPFSAETIRKLTQKIDPSVIETRDAGRAGDKLLYAPWVHYQQVLFDAFGVGGYRLVPTGNPRTVGNVKTWPGALFVRSPGSKKFQFVKSAVGECQQHAGMSEGNACEGAQSDCLVKCCKGLGIFMELFDPRYRRWWTENYTKTHEAQKKAAEMPAAKKVIPSAVTTPDTDATVAEVARGGEATITSDNVIEAFPGAKVVAERAADTGEAPSADAVESCRNLAKKMQWKAQYSQIWLKGHFGISKLAEATARQAENIHILLSALSAKKPEVFEDCLDEMVAQGEATRMSPRAK